MELKIGDKVRYNFPFPKNSETISFVGAVEIIADTHIYLRNEEGVRLKISFKHFDLIEMFDEELVTENYFG